MKMLTSILVLVCISTSAFATEFDCDKTAAEQAIAFLSDTNNFSGDLEIGKFNHLTVIKAYQTYLEAQIAVNPAQKQALLAQAIEICGARD